MAKKEQRAAAAAVEQRKGEQPKDRPLEKQDEYLAKKDRARERRAAEAKPTR